VRRRGYPSRRQVIVRRVVALAVLVGTLSVGIWAAAAGLRSGEENTAPPPPTTTGAPPKILKLLFPEGFTRREMAARVEAQTPVTAKAYLAATDRAKAPATFGKPRNLEGFLFPATYEIFETDKADRIVRDQLAAFQRNWAQVKLAYPRSKNLTPYDVLIIASMIEKEAKVQRERALISAVIYNRLRARIPLGIDATLRYGLSIPPTKAITQSDLDSDTPYNTRKFQGLPPTPIANPGLASMKAAARPANVNYLYFVRKPDCRTHFFTNSIEEFNNYTREGLNKTC
jgi:UPF0755 protein